MCAEDARRRMQRLPRSHALADENLARTVRQGGMPRPTAPDRRPRRWSPEELSLCEAQFTVARRCASPLNPVLTAEGLRLCWRAEVNSPKV